MYLRTWIYGGGGLGNCPHGREHPKRGASPKKRPGSGIGHKNFLQLKFNGDGGVYQIRGGPAVQKKRWGSVKQDQ